MLSGISLWQLLIVLAIVIMVFGTKRIRNVGADLGGAFKGFKDAVKDGENTLKSAADDESAVIVGDLDKNKDPLRS